MKFKNSHILLVSLISLFLLLSMAAVSAASDADDIAQDTAIGDISEIEGIENNVNDAKILSQVEESSDFDKSISAINSDQSIPAASESNDEDNKYGDDDVSSDSTENNTINVADTVKVNNSTKNATIPFSITNTNANDGTVTNFTVEKNDLKLVLTYNKTQNVINNFALKGNIGNYTLDISDFIKNLNFTTDLYKADLTIIYKYGTPNETNKTIVLKAFADAYLKPIVTETDYQFGQFKFKLVDANNVSLANCNVTISGLSFFGIGQSGISMLHSIASDENGYIIFNNTFLHNDDMTGLAMMLSYNFTSLPAGKYNVTFKSDGFFELNSKAEITVNKINATIKATNAKDYYGKIIHYAFQIVRAGTDDPIKCANVEFKIVASNIDAVRNLTSNLTGWCVSPDLNLSVNTYNLTLSSIDDNLNCSAVKKNLTITQATPVLTASNRTIYYNSGYSAIVQLKNKQTGKAAANAYVLLRVYTSSKKYTDFLGLTNKNGKIYLSTPLSVGKHKVIIRTADTNYKESKITRYITVKKATGKFTASKLTTYYKSGKIYEIKLTNAKNKKPMYYSNVNIKVYISKNKYYNYTGTTNGSGIIQLKIGYTPGTYKVVISSADKGYSAKAITSQIKVTKSPIKIAPTALKVKKGKYFKVKVSSTKSKKALASVKVNVKVYTGKKYKTYTIKTNKKGIASLKISQKVGKHKVVLSLGSPSLYSAKALTKTLTVTK